MVAGLSFKKVDRQTNATGLADIYTIIYEDNIGNKYTFGVENGTNTFNIFKYEPNNPNYGLSNKERHRNRGLFRLHGIGNQDRKNMN